MAVTWVNPSTEKHSPSSIAKTIFIFIFSVRGGSNSTQPALQVGCQQSMEQVFAGLAANRQPSSLIGARLETSLNGFADVQILLLHARADCDALLVVFTATIADLSKKEIENHPAVIHVQGQNEVAIHVVVIAIDHQVGILPEVPGAVALANRAGSGVLGGRHHRAGLQAIPVFILDGVLLVIEHAVEPLVQMRYVVAAVEVIVNEDFPVA